MWSCARINPNARELPASSRQHTKGVLGRALATCDQRRVFACAGENREFQFSAQTPSLYESALGNNVPIGSSDINNVCGEAHKCKLEFSSVVFVLNHLDETILKALSFPWHLE